LFNWTLIIGITLGALYLLGVLNLIFLGLKAIGFSMKMLLHLIIVGITCFFLILLDKKRNSLYFLEFLCALGIVLSFCANCYFVLDKYFEFSWVYLGKMYLIMGAVFFIGSLGFYLKENWKHIDCKKTFRKIFCCFYSKK